jgi:hypothetical protein
VVRKEPQPSLEAVWARKAQLIGELAEVQ